MTDKRTFIFTVHCDIDYVEFPEFVELKLTPAEIDIIGKAVDLIAPYGQDGYDCVELRVGEIEFYENDDKGNRIDFDGGSSYDPLWRVEGERVKVNAYGVSVIGYDKWSGYQYWSDSIPFAQMKNISDDPAWTDEKFEVPN
jgi:hypothetical protein